MEADLCYGIKKYKVIATFHNSYFISYNSEKKKCQNCEKNNSIVTLIEFQMFFSEFWAYINQIWV